MRKGPFVDA